MFKNLIFSSIIGPVIVILLKSSNKITSNNYNGIFTNNMSPTNIIYSIFYKKFERLIHHDLLPVTRQFLQVRNKTS